MRKKLEIILGFSLVMIFASIVVPPDSNFSMFHLEQAFATVDSVSPLSGPLKTTVSIRTHQQQSDCFGTPTAHFHFAKFNGAIVTSNLCPGGGFSVPLNGIIGMNTIRVEMGPAFEVTSFVDFPFTILHPILDTVFPSSGQPGQSISIFGTNFPLNHDIKVLVGGTLVTTIQSSSTGSLDGTFSVPNLAPGPHLVVVTWDGGMPSGLQTSLLRKQLTILAPPPSCGDGIVNQATEQCDPAPAGSLPTATCDINCRTITISCGPGTTLNVITNQCDPDVTQAQHDALQAALAQGDAILATLFEFLRVFGLI